MADHVSKQKRSEIMAAIKGKDTKPEYVIRRLLHAAGFRYRLHVKDLPGKPDIVLPKYKAVIFVHGCFWHGHNCNPSKGLPKTSVNFWKNKILTNQLRDENNINSLLSKGWRICILWECTLNRKYNLDHAGLMLKLSKWLKDKDHYLEIAR